MCQSFKGVRCLGDVRSLGHSWTQRHPQSGTVPPSVRNCATLGAEAARGHWPPTKVSAPTQSCRQRPCVIPEYLSSLVCSRVCPARKSRRVDLVLPTLCVPRKWNRRVAWQLSSPPQGTSLHIACRSKQHRHRTGRFTFRSQCGWCPPPAVDPASETAPKPITVKASQFTGSLSDKEDLKRCQV
jgi:hypothetical protein